MDISIIILNYKTKKPALNCIKSIKESDFGDLKYEIIVVDNDSQDGLGKILAWQYPDIKFIQNKANVGMGAGNNFGIKKAQGEFIMILNSDTRLKPTAVGILHEYIKNNKQVGIVSPELLNSDLSHQESCFRFPSFFIPILRRTFLGKFFKSKIEKFTMKDFGLGNIMAVDWAMGSCMLIRKNALDRIGGGFDERFFMYLEDTDLCRRMWQAGWKVIYNPEAQIIHEHGRGSARQAWFIAPFTRRLAREHIRSWLKYFWKWGIK